MKTVGAEQIERIEKEGIAVKTNFDGKNLSTFLSGGKINYAIYPSSEKELKSAVSILHDSKYHFLGLGSNSLIADEGVNAILTTRKLKGFSINGTVLRAEAGESVHRLAVTTARAGLSGMEFLCGIPGSVGGAVKMNAGAFGQEVKDVLIRAKLFDGKRTFYANAADMSLAYRYSDLMGAIVLSCEFSLKRNTAEECVERLNAYLFRRKTTQPKEPSLGSVFKRINGISPAEYIESLNMKGFRIGDAILSEKHCNFIVNGSSAKSADYIELMEKIRRRAKKELNIELESEIILIKD